MQDITLTYYKEDHAEAISDIITRNINEVLIKDYTEEHLQKSAGLFTPDHIKEMYPSRHALVALHNEKPIGTLSVVKSNNGVEGDYHFLTIFVYPEYHRMGIGRLLIEAGEQYVSSLSGKKISIPSSITSHLFYHKLGFQYQAGFPEVDREGFIQMYKNI